MKNSLIKAITCTFLITSSSTWGMDDEWVMVDKESSQESNTSQHSSSLIQQKEESLPQPINQDFQVLGQEEEEESVKREIEIIQYGLISGIQSLNSGSKPVNRFIDPGSFDYHWKNMEKRPLLQAIKRNSKPIEYDMDVVLTIRFLDRFSKEVRNLKEQIPFTISDSEILQMGKIGSSDSNHQILFHQTSVTPQEFKQYPQSLFLFTEEGRSHYLKIIKEIEKIISKKEEDIISVNVDINMKSKPIVSTGIRDFFAKVGIYKSYEGQLVIPAQFEKSPLELKDSNLATIKDLVLQTISVDELQKQENKTFSKEEDQGGAIKYLANLPSDKRSQIIRNILCDRLFQERELALSSNDLSYVYQPVTYYHPSLTLGIGVDPEYLLNAMFVKNQHQFIRSTRFGESSECETSALKKQMYRVQQFIGKTQEVVKAVQESAKERNILEGTKKRLLEGQSFGTHFNRINEGILKELAGMQRQDARFWVKDTPNTKYMVYNKPYVFEESVEHMKNPKSSAEDIALKMVYESTHIDDDQFESLDISQQVEKKFLYDDSYPQISLFNTLVKEMKDLEKKKDLVTLLPIAVMGNVGHAVFLSIIINKEDEKNYTAQFTSHDSVILGRDNLRDGKLDTVRNELEKRFREFITTQNLTLKTKTERVNSGTQELFSMDCVYQALGSMVSILNSPEKSYFGGIKDINQLDTIIQSMKEMTKGLTQKREILLGYQQKPEIAMPWEQPKTVPHAVDLASLGHRVYDYDNHVNIIKKLPSSSN